MSTEDVLDIDEDLVEEKDNLQGVDVNLRVLVEYYKFAAYEGVPLEFVPALDDVKDAALKNALDAKHLETIFGRANGVKYDDEFKRPLNEKRLIWPLMCWICREPIFRRREFTICSSICNRAYHDRCQNIIKGQFNNIVSHILQTSKKKLEPYEFLKNEYGKLDRHMVKRDSFKNVKGLQIPNSNTVCGDIYRPCFFCSISHVGCTGCRRFSPERSVIKCAVEHCTTFYCFPDCIEKTRVILPDKRTIDIHIKKNGNLKGLLDHHGRPLFICHQHTCWSCYDCDRYSFHWESFWRNELGKNKSAVLLEAWNSLKNTCRGKVETSHFARVKRIPKPERYPELKIYRSFFQSSRSAASLPKALITEEAYDSSEDENADNFQKGPTNILLKCTRCERTWCMHCVHPDTHIIPKSGKQIICHDCIHLQVSSTLAQCSQDPNNRENIMKKQCVSPSLRIDSTLPKEIYQQLVHFVREQASYASQLHSPPQFLDRPLAEGLNETIERMKRFGSSLYLSELINVNSKSRDLSKLKGQKTNEEICSYIRKKFDTKNMLRRSLANMRSKEWKSVIGTCDPQTIIKLSGEFKYIIANVIPPETKKWITVTEPTSTCSCLESCDLKTCSNAQKNVECNRRICNLGEVDCGNRKFKNYTRPPLTLDVVKDKGVGAFATEDIIINSLVCEYVGEVITQNEFQRHLNSISFSELDDNSHCHWYIMKVSKDVYIDSTRMGNVARFVNHSCDPNCSGVPVIVDGVYRTGVFALRNIKKGEEITYNYGFTSKGVGGGFKCHCNAKNCRGIIGVQPTLTNESLMAIEAMKNNGSENDLLIQLASDITSLYASNHVPLLKPRPTPLDQLNGIWTSGDLYRYERLNSRAKEPKFEESQAKILRKLPQNPLDDFLADNIHVVEAQVNYAKLLALGGLNIHQYHRSNSKLFAINIPWSILALETNDAAHKVAMESCCSFGEFYPLSKRFIQSATMVMAREYGGRISAENMQDILDLTWGITEACFACGGYGDCRYCDFCGDVLHDDSNCGDFYVNRQGVNLCPICQNSEHRYQWFLAPEIERERLAMRLWSLRLKTVQTSLMNALVEGANGLLPGIIVDADQMLVPQDEANKFKQDTKAFLKDHFEYLEELEEALDTYQTFW